MVYIYADHHHMTWLQTLYELVEECDDDHDAKLGISELRKAVLEELKMHNSLIQNLNDRESVESRSRLGIQFSLLILFSYYPLIIDYHILFYYQVLLWNNYDIIFTVENVLSSFCNVCWL